MTYKKSLRSRPGFSIIEMIVLISVSGVLLVVNATWIHQSLKYASVVKDRQRHHQSLLQLAWNLRDDVSASEEMSLVEKDRLVLISSKGIEIRYVISGTNITVEKLSEGQLFFRDRYELSRRSVVTWGAEELPDWISLIVYRGREGKELPNTESTTTMVDNGPIDLHIRIAPRRWDSQ